MHSNSRDLFYSLFPDKTKYLTFDVGDLPIMLSAPHGGNIKPISISKRKWGNRSRDTYTRRLIQKVIELFSGSPYFIYSDIHRNRVDLNRDITEACQGNSKAEDIWRLWNNFLKIYTQEISKKFSRGLYIDIHSHNNSNLFQIGYGLKVKDYLDLQGGWEIKNHSTLFPLVSNDYSEKSLCFGYFSIIASLEAKGYRVLTPKDDDEYLNGGRNIRQFSGNNIGAIQIECPIPVLRKDFNGVAYALKDSIELFVNKFVV